MALPTPVRPWKSFQATDAVQAELDQDHERQHPRPRTGARSPWFVEREHQSK